MFGLENFNLEESKDEILLAKAIAWIYMFSVRTNLSLQGISADTIRTPKERHLINWVREYGGPEHYDKISDSNAECMVEFARKLYELTKLFGVKRAINNSPISIIHVFQQCCC
jgi:hypothetical protein